MFAKGTLSILEEFLLHGKHLGRLSHAHIFFLRSEANDLALRLARQYTGHQDVVVLDQ
jgi:4-aminobutyrate aminotransferase-like enzyme